MKKRVFSLLLILALLMSLWVTAGAVDLNYKDKDEITYKEAVAVLSREGIITGFEDGTFRPKETLTRSQACTILTKILGGQPNGEADFTDVRPGSWYAGYVAYCAYNELVAGNGDGTFNPAGQLTGSAWSKMLLTGLGYDAEASGMLGRGWATGVAALASEESLYDDIENFDPDRPVTRDEACQIAYNAMFDGQVPEPPNNILTRLSYSFSNTRGAFSYPNPYQIPMEIFRLVYGDEIKAQKMYEKFGNWGGNCYGMVSTAGILYQYGNGISPSDFNNLSATPGGLSVSDRSKSLSLSLTQFIEALHVTQLSEELNEVKSENWNDLSGLVDKVKEARESGKAPVLVCVWGPEGGHAIMGYDVEEVNSSESRVLVYDPNYPMDQCYITLTKSGGSYTGWSYPISHNMIWNDMNGAMSYIPYADYYQGWQNRKGSVITSDMLFMTVSDDAVIYDENGNRAAEVWNGKVNVYQENIYPMWNIGIVLDDNGLPSTETTIWLPGHSYSVKHSGSGEFTVELTEKTQTASVTTTASSVGLNVEDSSALRTVSIPSSEQSATYTIDIRSSMEEDGGAASIRLSGTVSDSGVTAGSDSGTLVTDGADPGRDTLYVDDQPIYEAEPEHVEEPEYPESAKPADPGNTQEVYHVGDTFHDGSIDITFVSSENTGSYNEFLSFYSNSLQEGQHWIKVTFLFTNTSDDAFGKSREYAYLRNFKSNASAYDTWAAWASDDDEYLDPGKSALGYIYLAIADEDDDYFFYELKNVPSELRETIKLCATEEKDSGYVPEKDYALTPGALSVGDSFEEPGLLKLEYLSCKPAEVDEWSRREGYHWVTCEIEFEDQDWNQEANAAQFSLYDSNVLCYADGFRCRKQYQSHWLDFCDLAKGEKAVMTVTFEVPDDAQTVEVLIHSYYGGVNMMFDASVSAE